MKNGCPRDSGKAEVIFRLFKWNLSLWDDSSLHPRQNSVLKHSCAVPTWYPSHSEIFILCPEWSNELCSWWQILIGCQTDNISHHANYLRPPMVTHEFLLDQAKKHISWLWGGLLYILVPSSYKLGTVPVTIKGAVAAPYFKLGK